MNPCVRSSLRRACAVLVLVPALSASPAAAEPVTHQFVGQVTTLGGPLDLSGVFALGQPVTLDYTIERSTTPVQQDAYVTAYTDAISMISFSIGSWSGGGAPATSNATVTNNAPSPAPPGNPYDQWSWNALGVAAPPLGSVTLQSLTSTLDDIEGTVFDSGAIPRAFPALGVFDGKTATFLVFDMSQFKSGWVMATLSGVTTAAAPTTWGRIKNDYR